MLVCFSVSCGKSIDALWRKLKLCSQHVCAVAGGGTHGRGPMSGGDSDTPHFAGSPVSTGFTSQPISQQSRGISDASLTLACFKGRSATLKNQIPVQVSFVLMVIRNPILHYVKFHAFVFKSSKLITLKKKSRLKYFETVNKGTFLF